MTKDDYMKLSKERLAELLAERDARRELYRDILPNISPIVVNQRPLCYEPEGTCTNPLMDCINCPRKGSSYGTWTTDTAGNPIKGPQ